MEILYRDELFMKLSMNVDDVFLMLDAQTDRADYVSPNAEKLPGSRRNRSRRTFMFWESCIPRSPQSRR